MMKARAVSESIGLGVLWCLLAQGCDVREREQVATTAQEVRAGVSDEGQVLLGVDLLATDAEGRALPCDVANFEVTVEVSRNGPDGPFQRLDAGEVEVLCVDVGRGDLAMVLDNSKSVFAKLEMLREGARRVADRILGDGGRVSLARVSTEARVLAELTEDRSALEAGLSDLFITNGWTALYDGIRMGNETLGRAGPAADEVAEHANLSAFCGAARKHGIIAFTDGAENNSSHQRHWSEQYAGDGIDTTIEDLHALQLGGVTTPVYTVGLGDEVEHEALSGLAEATGGRHRALDHPGQIDDVLAMIAEYYSSAQRLCTVLPDHVCGGLDVRVTHSYQLDEERVEGESLHHISVPCAPRANGRVATVLLTLDASEIGPEIVTRLVAQTMNWTSPVDAPRVLFVRDDFHHGEFEHDTAYIYQLLADTGYDAQLLEEPELGLTLDQLTGFDVVWFSNPGYPMDDLDSFDALLQFSAAGGGVVLQGDDMSWSYGHEFPTTPLTRLEHVDNGVSYCGERVNNLRSGRYRVTLEAGEHPILSGLEGLSFLYGDDIDTATPVGDGEEVLAWATVEGVTDCESKPVIVGFTPSE
jgi:hypothetical protein